MIPADLGLVADLALQLHRGPLRDADLGDLLSWGALGALEAGAGAGRLRVSGAMIDGARREWGLRGRARKKPPIAGELALAGAADRAPRPDQALERAQMERFVRDAIATLPPREMAVIEAVYWGDLTLEEAGAALGVQRAQACKLRAAALGRLKRRLGEVRP